MYLGRIVEVAPTAALFCDPLHPYTRALLSAIPVVSAQEAALLPEEITLAGEIPSPTDVTPYCGFRARCPQRIAICDTEPPPLLHINATAVRTAPTSPCSPDTASLALARERAGVDRREC
jgi:peptide/nickel transport system ATP-binding protein